MTPRYHSWIRQGDLHVREEGDLDQDTFDALYAQLQYLLPLSTYFRAEREDASTEHAFMLESALETTKASFYEPEDAARKAALCDLLECFVQQVHRRLRNSAGLPERADAAKEAHL